MIVFNTLISNSATMKKPTFNTIKASLLGVDCSFFKLLNDGPRVFQLSWLSIGYLSGVPTAMERILLTVTYPGVPGRKRKLPPRALIADGAYTGCRIGAEGWFVHKK